MRICIINTGGTIGCTGQPLSPMPADRFAAVAEALLGPALAAALPGDRIAFDTGLRFDGPTGTLDSTDLRPSDWCRMAGRVLDLYDDHDAFVILHGTDTMDHSGMALALLLNVFDAWGLPRATLSKPVILTGAQLPLFAEAPGGPMLNAGGDGLANLTGALRAARLRLPEVAIFFDGRLLRGSRALKVSTTCFAAFDSPHAPPLAQGGIGLRLGGAEPQPGPAAPHLALDAGPARDLARAQVRAVAAVIDSRAVAQIPAVPADGPLLAGMVRHALGAGVAGLVLEGFGAGNVPQGGGEMRAALSSARVPVLIASRAVGGQVGAFDYAAGAWIAGTGARAAGDMTPVAALVKLAVLTAAQDHHGWSRAQLDALLARSLVGECAATDRLSGPLHPGQALEAVDGTGDEPVRLVNDPDHGPRLTRGARVLWQAPGPGCLRLSGGTLALIAPDGARPWSVPAAPGAVAVLTAHPPALRLIDPTGAAAPVTALAG